MGCCVSRVSAEEIEHRQDAQFERDKKAYYNYIFNKPELVGKWVLILNGKFVASSADKYELLPLISSPLSCCYLGLVGGERQVYEMGLGMYTFSDQPPE